MKNICNYTFTLIVIFLVTAKSYSQQTISKDSLKRNINIAFNSLAEIDSLFFEPQLKEELILDYLKYFWNISDKNFNNKDKAKNLINYYSTPEGIKNLIREYSNTMSKNYTEIFSFGQEAYINVYSNSDNINAMMRANSLNKYALLLPKTESENTDYELYINSKFICFVKQAKNGIRVHSGKEYLIEFKLDKKASCSQIVSFTEQEQKVISCKIAK